MKALDDLFASVNRGDAPGLVVGVARHGRVIYRRGFGLASVEHGTVNTPRTRMRLASVTKHMTCMAVLLLAEDGKLDIDAPVGTLVPELPESQAAPTLRQLMGHRGGLHCVQELMYLSSGLAFQPRGIGLALQRAQHGVNFAPGAGRLYCNGGYGLLSIAIERASGSSFESFLKARLFEPLGMTETAAVPNDLQIVPGIATFHLPHSDGRWRRGILPLEDNRGEGAVVTTVDDMLRWLAHLRAPVKQIGVPTSWALLTTLDAPHEDAKAGYALGLNRHPYRGVEVIQHGGSLVGAASQMVTVPAHGLDIILMTNGALVNPVQLGWQIVDALLAGHLEGEPAQLARSERFAHLFGRHWHGSSGRLIGFGDVGGLLGMSLDGAPPMPFLQDRGAVLGIGFEEAGMGPIELRVDELLGGGESPPTLSFSDAGRVETLHLLPAKPPSQARAARELAGRYRVPELLGDAEVRIEGEQLQLAIHTDRGTRRAELRPLSGEVFTVRMTDPDAPAFPSITVVPGGFMLSSVRARGIFFERIAA